MSSVGIELVNEIERVSALRENYRNLPHDAGRFAIIMMDAAIEDAKKQLHGDDPVAAIRAYKTLKEFTE